jgi:hypothetical protein
MNPRWQQAKRAVGSLKEHRETDLPAKLPVKLSVKLSVCVAARNFSENCETSNVCAELHPC